MNDKSQEQPSYITRVIPHDSTRKATAAAAAGILIAAISEALWPTGS